MEQYGQQLIVMIGQGITAYSSIPAQAAAGGPTNGLLQEDGTSFILAENNDFLVQE